MLLLAAVFIFLGIWQVQRRVWKHQLIATVDARLRATPAAPPPPADWPRVTADRDAYRRVTVSGHYLAGRDTFVRATTELGSGYWMMTPLETNGFAVLVNRGFVTPDQRVSIRTTETDPVKVTGLLRITEPKGGFLRTNDAAGDHWYSRDVAAIAAARRLDHMAPYFIDADDSANAPGKPVGGLTVIHFNDNHLVYALTWFGMALLSLGAAWRFARERGDRSATAA